MLKTMIVALALLAGMPGLAAAQTAEPDTAPAVDQAFDTGTGKFFQKTFIANCNERRRCQQNVVTVPKGRQLLIRFIACGAPAESLEYRVAFLISVGPAEGLPLGPVQRSINDGMLVSQMVYLSATGGHRVTLAAVSDGKLSALTCTVSGDWVK